MTWMWWFLALADPAPTKVWHGLELGAADGAAMDAWLAERTLTCPPVESPRRVTTHRVCSDVPLTVLPDRDVAGKITRILMASLDTGPLHHVSTDRRYSVTQAGVDDYIATQKALTTKFGKPSRADKGRVVEATNARFASEWIFDDLHVRLSLLRFQSGPWTVSERWEVPGVEAAAGERPGSTNPHGGTPTTVKNPHILN